MLIIVNFVEYIYAKSDDSSNGHDAEKEPQCCTGDGNPGKKAGKNVSHTYSIGVLFCKTIFLFLN